MDLATMRTTFQRHTAGLADDLAEDEIDTYLNAIFAEFLPADVDGKVHEVTWVSQLTSGENPLAIPAHIVGFPTGRFYIQGTAGDRTGTIYPLGFYDALDAFLADFPNYQDDTYTGRPCAVFRQGKSLYFDRFPDDAYNLIADARGAQTSELTADGLPFNHAMAVVTGAAWNFLLEQEDEAGVAREATQFETWKGRFQLEAHLDRVGHVPNRSF